MEALEKVTYSQWLEYVNAAKEKGLRSEEMKRLRSCYPAIGGEEYFGMAASELAKLESVLLKSAVAKFQSFVNKCLEEADIESLERGMKELKKNIQTCFFFRTMEEIPLKVRKELSDQIVENLLAFIKEYNAFVKRFRDSDNSLFAEDFEYICKKAKLKKFVEEFNIYG